VRVLETMNTFRKRKRELEKERRKKIRRGSGRDLPSLYVLTESALAVDGRLAAGGSYALVL
jgi:hypothetical protein